MARSEMCRQFPETRTFATQLDGAESLGSSLGRNLQKSMWGQAAPHLH